MTKFVAGPCPHPEESREPVDYVGQPADPDEWECTACGTIQLRKEPQPRVVVGLDAGLGDSISVLVGHAWLPHIAAMKTMSEISDFTEEFTRQVQKLILTTQLAGTTMRDFAEAADALRRHTNGHTTLDIHYIVHPDTARRAKIDVARSDPYLRNPTGHLMLFGSEVLEIDIPPDRLGVATRREIDHVLERILMGRAWRPNWGASPVVPVKTPVIYSPVVDNKVSVSVMDPDTGVVTEIGSSVVTDVQFTFNTAYKEKST